MKRSAGILAFRKSGELWEVFLVHPGGPFWKNKDEHAWSVPKGEFTEEENPFDAAVREFREETGFTVTGSFTRLEPVRQPGGKIVHVWAVEAELNPGEIRSNTFTIEWPPRLGKEIEVPEVDKADWFSLQDAYLKIHKGQRAVLEQFERLLYAKDIDTV
jgi:predicted NUDIX family NTP pyrophosphohydrolase